MATHLQQAEFQVPGLCCLECSQGVATALRRTPGVQDLHVLLMAEKVLVTYDTTTTGPARLAQVVTDAGHPVTTWTALETDASRRAGATPDQALTHAAPQPGSRSTFLFAMLRLAFVGVVSLIALVEITGESLGLFHRVEIVVPVPLALAVVVVGGYPIFWSALQGLRLRQITINAVMSVGILAAAATGEVISAALIVFFMLIARFLEGKTTGRARRAIEELAELAPKTARVKRERGEETIAVAALHLGDRVVVRQGEHIPIDGIVLVGQATVNQAPITGEALPVEKNTGDEVFAGTLAEQGYLEVTVLRMGTQTALGHIIHHLEAAVAVLVAACPCAVGLATPLSVVAAVGTGARRGLLIKGGLVLEQLARVDTLVVDKTGTLTTGQAQVTELVRFDAEWSEDDLLTWAAALEHTASHPLASAIAQAAAERGLSLPEIEQREVRPSRGIVGQAHGETWLLGAWRLLEEEGVQLAPHQHQHLTTLEEAGQTVVVLARSGRVLGAVAVADTLHPEVLPALAQVARWASPTSSC